MDLKQQIGQEIRKRRHSLGMEQVDLCDYADIGSTTLSKLEQGKGNITLDTLEKIITVLGMDFSLQVKR